MGKAITLKQASEIAKQQYLKAQAALVAERHRESCEFLYEGSNMPTKDFGSKALAWGVFETKRLFGAAWPMLVAGGVAALTQLSTDAGSAGSGTAGIVAGLLAKALAVYTADNTGKRL